MVCCLVRVISNPLTGDRKEDSSIPEGGSR
jgi:hypothetical protein